MFNYMSLVRRALQVMTQGKGWCMSLSHLVYKGGWMSLSHPVCKDEF